MRLADGERKDAATPRVSPHVVMTVTTLAIGLGAVLGFLWGFLGTILRDDLGLSRAQVGLLVSFYFGSTGVGSIAGGVLTDRFGARLAVAANLATVACAASAVVLVPAYATLILASVVAGFAYALGNAGTNVAIAAAIPAARRGVALTLKTAGVPLVATVGALAGPWAATRFGWVAVIVTVGAMAAVVAAVSLIALPVDRPARAASAGRRDGSRALPKGFRWFPIASFLLVLGCSPLFTWVVPFLEESVGLTAAAAGMAASVAVTLGVVGMLLIARRSDRLGPGTRIRSVALWVGMTGAGLGVMTLGIAVGPAASVAGATIGFASQLGAIGLMHAAVVDVAPGAVGRASGVTMTGYYLGALIAPAGFGALVDLTGSYPLAWGCAMVALAASSLAFLRGAVVLSPAP